MYVLQHIRYGVNYILFIFSTGIPKLLGLKILLYAEKLKDYKDHYVNYTYHINIVEIKTKNIQNIYLKFILKHCDI